MTKLLFVLASTATFAIINPAIAQYVAPAPGVGVGPGYTAPGYTPPGYKWREQRLNEDPRRSDSAGQQTQQLSPNNATSSGSVGVTDPNAVGGECAKGFSEETCRRRGQKYNPLR